MKTYQVNMMKKISKVKGFGLIEILVSLVVVSIGMIAIAGLQGTLLNSGADVKARAEALDQAKHIMEERKNYITSGVTTDANGDPLVVNAEGSYFTELVAGTTVSSYTGVNAQFTRTVTITDDTETDGSTLSDLSGPNGVGLKKIAVEVTWVDGQGDAQNVYMATFASFIDPAQTQAISSGVDANASTNPVNSALNSGNASVNATDAPDTSNANESQASGSGSGDVSDDVYTRDNGSDGIEVIVPVSKDGATTYSVVLTVYGGVTHSIEGTVYNANANAGWSDAAGVNVSLDASEPSYCLFPFNVDASCGVGNAASCADYVCFYGGDNTASAATPAGTVNGGWYGKIGITGTTDTICSAGSDANSDPARLYVSARGVAAGAYNGLAGTNYDSECAANGTYFHTLAGATSQGVCSNNTYYDISAYEGINTSYTCQDFIIGTTDCAASAATLGVNLPDQNVIRFLDGTLTPVAENTALTTNSATCADPAFIVVGGSISWVGGAYELGSAAMVGNTTSLGENGSCTINNSAGITYSCTFMGTDWVGDVSVNVVDGTGTAVAGCTGNVVTTTDLSSTAGNTSSSTYNLSLDCPAGVVVN